MSRIRIPLNPDPDVQDPDAAESKNRRQWPRYAFPERESFTLTADGRTATCAIEDISLGGARLRMEGPVPGNPELRLPGLASIRGALDGAGAPYCSIAVGGEYHLGVIRLDRHPAAVEPISPINQVKVRARKNSTYWEIRGICPQRISPSDFAPR